MSRFVMILAVAGLLVSPLAAQEPQQQPQPVTYFPFFTEQWSNPPNPTTHNDQPVSLCPEDVPDQDALPCRCPRSSAQGMGTFAVNGAIYSIFGTKSLAQSNHLGVLNCLASDACYDPSIPHEFNSVPYYIGDHVDAFYRYDSDGAYDRIPDFFTYPPNEQLVTLADDSVKQAASDTRNSVLQNNESVGSTWQIGNVFAPIIGPPLSTDPSDSVRLYAFFGAESWPTDAGISAHLVGFASIDVSPANNSLPKLWYDPANPQAPSAVWKDSSSPNDGEYKQTHQLPLRTLYVKNFTPVLAFRGDADIRRYTSNENVPIGGSRYLLAMTGWYRDGYFFLMTSTMLTTDLLHDNVCNPGMATNYMSGLALLRVKADLSGTSGFRGLWLDSNKVPDVAIFNTQTRQFVPIRGDQIVSFRDDSRPTFSTGGNPACVENRQFFGESVVGRHDGCCANPDMNASDAMIYYPDVPNYPDAMNDLPPGPHGEEARLRGTQLRLSSNFMWQDPCSRYVAVSPTDSSFLLLRVRDNAATCGLDEPLYTFEHAGWFTHDLEPQYVHVPLSGDAPGLWPLPDNATTLVGYRPVAKPPVDPDTQVAAHYGQRSFTVVPDLLNCKLNISPTSDHLPASGGSGTITIAAPETRCLWNGQASDSFISLTSPSSGVGNGDITYSVAANSGAQRTGTITVSGHTFTITQAGAALPAPTQLTATRQSTTTATISWQSSAGATAYELFRATNIGAFGLISSNATSPFTDAGLTPGTTYLYEVRATNGGQASSFSNVDLTTTILFTDDPLVRVVTVIRAVQLTELRQAVDAVRAAADLPAGSYTDSLLVGSTPVKAVHAAELRSQLNDALVALGLGATSFTDPTLTPGETPIKTEHIQELRIATK